MIVGVICIVWGIIALVTPLTPGAWLIFVGLEIFGYRILFWEKTKLWLKTKAVVWWQKREQIWRYSLAGMVYSWYACRRTVLQLSSRTVMRLRRIVAVKQI